MSGYPGYGSTVREYRDDPNFQEYRDQPQGFGSSGKESVNAVTPGIFSMFFCLLLIFFKINFFEKFIQKYDQSVKQFGSRSGPTFCRTWSGFKLFAKVISRLH